MILTLLIVLAELSLIQSQPFYRKDYTYNGDRDAFYKLIWTPETVTYDSAVTTCDNEGAQLFYPKDADEWMVIKSLQNTLIQAPNNSAVLIGIYNINGQFITLDGLPTTVEDKGGSSDCVSVDLNTGNVSTCEVTAYPRLFACKKSYEARCPTIDLSYEYNTVTRKCYKVNNRKVTWYGAVSECILEGGILVVLESSEEAKEVLQRISRSSEMKFHSGFRKLGKSFYTLKGKKLENSYMSQMDEPPTHSVPQLNYPPRYRGYERAEETTPVPPVKNCGVIEHSVPELITTKSTECSELRPFICEMKPRF